VGDSGRVYATEVDRDDLRKIRDRVERDGLNNVLVVEGTQNETGLPRACCDAILLRRVYHHFQEPASMRASLREALSEDGLLLIVDFGTKRHWGRPSGVPESRTGHGIEKDMIVAEMQRDGFELVRELDWRGNDYALLFKARRGAP
jgi:SAM-dependent methyltransferase